MVLPAIHKNQWLAVSKSKPQGLKLVYIQLLACGSRPIQKQFLPPFPTTNHYHFILSFRSGKDGKIRCPCASTVVRRNINILRT